MKYFYSSLIEIESIVTKLDQLDLSREEKHHLAELVDSSLHHTILDAILSQLSEEDKRVFLRYVHEDDHKKIWEFLSGKIDNIEDKIKKAAEDLKEELHGDLREAKAKK